MIEKVNLFDKFSQFDDYWNPRRVGRLNGQEVKIARFKGEFVWHEHADEDEMFYVLKGQLKIELKDKVLELGEGEFAVIPKGVSHRPVAEEEAWVMLFEPEGTLNTGDAESELTRNQIDDL